MADELAAFGVNQAGNYLVDPQLPEETIARFALEQGGVDSDVLERLLNKRNANRLVGFGPVDGVDPLDLASAGWALVAPFDLDPGIRQALEPLLDLRREQCGGPYSDGGRYAELKLKPDDTANSFLVRNRVGPGRVDPARGVPYYLLLVADPQQVSFRFQYQLDVQFSVGRLHFDGPRDEALQKYSRHARSVAQARPRPRKATIFAVKNLNDRPTSLSHDKLCGPVHRAADGAPGWSSRLIDGDQARPDRLARELAQDPPSLLFTAGHGVSYDRGDPRQLALQGALICQGWRPYSAVERADLFAAEDIPETARLEGMVAFLFACYGGGTPLRDEFAEGVAGAPSEAIAPRPFVAALPQALLSHPNGGAMAVVSHVERAWSTSFTWQGVNNPQAFEDLVRQLARGVPVGHAMDTFGSRYAELSTYLSDTIKGIRSYGDPLDAGTLALYWTANSDAKCYVLFGDPAARLAFADQEPPAPLDLPEVPITAGA